MAKAFDSELDKKRPIKEKSGGSRTDKIPPKESGFFHHNTTRSADGENK